MHIIGWYLHAEYIQTNNLLSHPRPHKASNHPKYNLLRFRASPNFHPKGRNRRHKVGVAMAKASPEKLKEI